MLVQTFLLGLVAGSLAAPSSSYVLHEERLTKLNGRTTRISKNTVLPVRIGLTQSNVDKTYETLMDVSDPTSSNYGKHWTADEVNAMYAPSEESVQAVRDWLVSSGIDADSIVGSRNQGWVAVDMPAHQAEKLFKTEYFEHENSNDGTVRLGCDSYSLPNHIREHVDFIKPGVSLSAPVAKKIMKRSRVGRSTKNNKAWHGSRSKFSAGWNGTSSNLASCGSSITPSCIKALYNVPDADPNATVDPANSLGIFESGDVYAQKDLDLFFKTFATYVPKGTHPTPALIDGATAPVGVNSFDNTGESDIDLSMAYSLIYPQSVTLFQEPGQPNLNASASVNQTENDLTFITPFLDAIDGSYCTSLDSESGFQCGDFNLTRVISMSYGSTELDPSTGSVAAQQRACTEIAKLGLQGTTFVVSSGDYGVAAHPQGFTNGCASSGSSGLNAQAINGSIFEPSFPATCPYVLAVGATQLTAGETVADTEGVMNPGNAVQGDGVGATFSSGGGFANFFDMPSYQSSAVNAYFSQHDPGYAYYHAANGTGIGANGGKYNRGGRGIPDVSANGAFFAAFNQGQQTPFFGTSLAAPLWASLITLINDERSAAGKSPVGFINPALYANPLAFHDITVGSNPGCNTNGFPAVEGWEPSTGLGTPDYPSLLQVFLSLP